MEKDLDRLRDIQKIKTDHLLSYVRTNHLYISFVFSYPSHKQFDAIGTAIVRLLKLPFTKDNLVSLFLIIL